MITVLLIISLFVFLFLRSNNRITEKLDDLQENLKADKENLDRHIKTVSLKREFMERELHDWATFQKAMDIRLKKLEALINIPKGHVIKTLPKKAETEVKSE